jgi:hypothetical protein
MASRREFLHMGIAALTLPISARVALGAAPENSAAKPVADAAKPCVPLYKVVYDTRYADSVAFGEEMKRLGANVHAIRGDITDLWYHDLDARWKQSPASIAGLTGPGALFCLERLAWDQRMRVVFRADHRYGGYHADRAQADQIEHVITGPEDAVRKSSEFANDDAGWPVSMANLLARFPQERARLQEMTSETKRAFRENDPEHLVSWVIAPKVSKATA